MTIFMTEHEKTALQCREIDAGVARAAAKHSGIGNVWEGPLVESLADVFRQMEEKGIGRRSEG